MSKQKNILPKNENGQAHGYWVYHYSDGKICFKGNYHNGKKVGYFDYYSLTGTRFKRFFIR